MVTNGHHHENLKCDKHNGDANSDGLQIVANVI
jgi:hypothetical protein